MVADAKAKAVVGVIMGSDSDYPVMAEAGRMLAKFGIGFEVEVVSAHRSPARAAEYAETAAKRGLKAIIVGAGVRISQVVVAALTTLPVIGVPMAATSLNGMDSLLATVQMPGGVPGGDDGNRQARGDERRHFRGTNSGSM